ncbi:hypothetical protein HK102_001923, partial [Quaeritorhiza haematococci]
ARIPVLKAPGCRGVSFTEYFSQGPHPRLGSLSETPVLDTDHGLQKSPHRTPPPSQPLRYTTSLHFLVGSCSLATRKRQNLGVFMFLAIEQSCMWCTLLRVESEPDVNNILVEEAGE